MAEHTFLGCDLKIWMYVVVSITILAGSLETYRAIRNYHKTKKIVDRVLLIGIPIIFLGAGIFGLLATCEDNARLLCPLLIAFTILIPLITISNVLFYIDCMSNTECTGDIMNIVSTTVLFIVTVTICVSTMIIVCRYYCQIVED